MGSGQDHHDHDSNHSHAHAHGVSADADRRWLTLALGLILAFMLAEVTIGLIAHSLALLSDAAHMLTDAASIVLALIAIRLAARPAHGVLTYGFQRDRNPVGAGQWRHPVGASGVANRGGDSPVVVPAGGEWRPRVGNRAGGDRGQHRCRLGDQQSQPDQPQR